MKAQKKARVTEKTAIDKIVIILVTGWSFCISSYSR